MIITQSRDTGNIGHKTQNKTSKTNKHNTETEKQLQNGRHKKKTQKKHKNKNKTKNKANKQTKIDNGCAFGRLQMVCSSCFEEDFRLVTHCQVR